MKLVNKANETDNHVEDTLIDIFYKIFLLFDILNLYKKVTIRGLKLLFSYNIFYLFS